MNSRLVYLVATEPSADRIGALLMPEFRARYRFATGDEVRFRGLGGQEMQDAACPMRDRISLVSDLAVMGFAEVIPKIPSMLLRVRHTVNDIFASYPALVVFIDGKGFSRRVASRVQQCNWRDCRPLLIQYVAPSIWAWRAEEASALRTKALFDHLLLLFPFEKPHWDQYQVPNTIVGSPVLEGFWDEAHHPSRLPQLRAGAASRLRADFNIPGERTAIVTVGLGSRPQELRRMTPILGRALQLARREVPGLTCIMPSAWNVRGTMEKIVKRWVAETASKEQGLQTLCVPGDSTTLRSVLLGSRAALVTSGTIALEAAFAGIPTTVAYAAHPFTAWMARRCAKVRYASIVNLIATSTFPTSDKPIFPEFLFQNCTSERIAESLVEQVTSDPTRPDQIDFQGRLASVLDSLTRHVQGIRPSQRAAEVLVRLITSK